MGILVFGGCLCFHFLNPDFKDIDPNLLNVRPTTAVVDGDR